MEKGGHAREESRTEEITPADSSGQASWELLESQPLINNEIMESITSSLNAQVTG
jgi:hypothetical protein